MKAPLVTVVVPTYKRFKYLQEAIPSALAQTFGDFEVIVTDDGCSDEIANYVHSLGDVRLRYRRNPEDIGIAMNNYTAFCEARGKYIASLHDDDVWEPRFLETMVPLLEADPEISVAFCDHQVIDEQSRPAPAFADMNARRYRRHLLAPGRHQPFIGQVTADLTLPMVMAAVFRRSILDGAEYPPRIGGCYDHWLAYLAVRDGQAVYYVPERLTRYRVHAGSGTATRRLRNLREAIYVRSRFLRDPRVAPFRGRIRNSIGVLYGKIALFYLARRRFRRGCVHLKKAFALLRRPKNMAALAINTALALGRPRVTE